MLDPVILAVLVLIAVLALWRLRRTYGQTREDRGTRIQSKLEELRKKRDEE